MAEVSALAAAALPPDCEPAADSGQFTLRSTEGNCMEFTWLAGLKLDFLDHVTG
jgi:hypothetical protein